MFEYTVFCLFIMFYVVEADSRVCSKVKDVDSVQLVSYVQTFTELSNADCLTNYDYYEYDCLKTVTKSKLMTRYKPQTEYITMYFCCPGYSQIGNLNSSSTNADDINCEPICDPPCQNGLCEAPQKCLCLPGYIKNPDPSNPCLPVCDLDCGHGICDKPNTCKCFTGYELTHTTSHAVCTQVQHKEIECISGYIKSIHGTCEPKCSNGCINGICISPEFCQCNPGFHLESVNIDGSKICRPDCDLSCGNGTCILPNVCECFRGYKIDITKFSSQANSNGFLCIPSCKGVCAGECVAPNTCITSTANAPISKYTTGPWSTTYQSTTTSLSTPQSTTFRSTATWWTTPRTTTSWSTNPVSTTRQYTEKNLVTTAKVDSTKTVKTNISESTHNGAEKTWVEQHWASVLLPLLFLLFAMLVTIIVWRRKPIIIYLRGRSYVVEDDVLNGYIDQRVHYSKRQDNVECK